MPLDLSRFALERQHSIPLARQLYVQCHRQIMRGVLLYGERLPSSRQLAQQLQISRGVVVECYEMLRLDGLVAGFGKGGTQVCYQHSAPDRQRKQALHLSLSKRGQTLADARDYDKAERVLALTPSVPDQRLFPHKQWLSLARAAWQQAPTWYQRTGGVPLLKQSLQRYLAQYRGIEVSDTQCLLITTGTQAALSVLAHLLADTGETALVEQPGWAGSAAAMQQAGLRVQTAPLDAAGACLPAGATPRLAVLTPGVQFPSGGVMSMARRQAWLDYSAAHGLWLIEDDYAAEYSYQQHPAPSLLAHASQAAVIHVGTLSKLLLPGLRLGWMVVPRHLAAAVCAALNTLGLQPPYALQQQLALFMQYGYLNSHLATTRAIYNQRRQQCSTYLQQKGADCVQVMPSASGMNHYLRLRERVTLADLSKRLRAVGLGCELYSANEVRHYLLFGHAALPEAELEPRLAQLLAVLRAV